MIVAANNPAFDQTTDQNATFSQAVGDKKFILVTAYIIGASNILGAFVMGIYLFRSFNKRRISPKSKGNSN